MLEVIPLSPDGVLMALGVTGSIIFTVVGLLFGLYSTYQATRQARAARQTLVHEIQLDRERADLIHQLNRLLAQDRPETTDPGFRG